MAIDYSSDVGKVRLLVHDLNEASPLFSDIQLSGFVGLARDNNLYRAAALALRALASNEVMVQKRIRLLDLSTDGPAEAKALRELAESYEKEATAVVDDPAGAFDWAEMVTDDFSARERVWKQGLRG